MGASEYTGRRASVARQLTIPRRRRPIAMLTANLRLAVRHLVHRPIFALTAIALLSIGGGANAAVLSIVTGVLLQPLPFREPERLVATAPTRFVSAADLVYLVDRLPSLEAAGGTAPGWMMALVDDLGALKIEAQRVTDNYFELLGARGVLGRAIRPGDSAPGRPRVAVLSERFWRQRYGASPDVVGRSVVIDNERHEIVGVAGPAAIHRGSTTDVWLPFPLDPSAPGFRMETFQFVGRVDARATIDRADADLRALLPEWRRELQHADDFADTTHLVPLDHAIVGDVRGSLVLLLGAVGFVLLIAAVNQGMLMLGRAVERAPELAVRVALGASRAQVTRLVIIEHLLLALCGTAVGIGLAAAALPSLVAWLPPDVPRLDEIRLDWMVVAAVMGASLIVAALLGLVPVAAALRVAPTSLIRESRGGPALGRHRALDVLVAAQIVVAVVLGVGATLMVRTLWQLQAVDPGFDAANVITMRPQPSSTYRTLGTGLPYLREVMTRVAALPGVTAVGAIQHLPLSGYSWTTPYRVGGRPFDPRTSPPLAGWRFVDGEYFRVMRIPLLAGRAFDERDAGGQPPVALVNETFARRTFGSLASALDQTLELPKPGSAGLTATRIVGVVRDVRHERLDAPGQPEIYRPLGQMFMMTVAIVARTSGDPAALASAVREAAGNVDRSVPIADVQPLGTVLLASLGRPRLVARLLLVFALGGLTLCAIGIYGVAAYRVRQRTRELGVRMALGASPARLGAHVMRFGLWQSLMGLVVGLPLARGFAQGLRGFLFGVTANDAATFVVLPAIVVGSALVACALPALRATRVDPVRAMRAE